MNKNDITYFDKLNELKLDINHPNSAGYLFILVEGDTDIRLYRKFFDFKSCKVEFVPGGNPKLEECVEDLLKDYPLVIGIRDADFIHLNGQLYSKVNMFLTDYHDLEITLIKEDEIFFAVLYEYTDIPKDQFSNIRDMIFKSIENISYLKWLNNIENLELNFNAGFQNLMVLNNFEVNFEEYFNRVVSGSPNAVITDFNTILNKIHILKRRLPDQYQLCNGHDFMKALSEFIRKQGKDKGISDERISSASRIAFRNEFLAKTTLFATTDSWAKGNGCTMYC